MSMGVRRDRRPDGSGWREYPGSGHPSGSRRRDIPSLQRPVQNSLRPALSHRARGAVAGLALCTRFGRLVASPKLARTDLPYDSCGQGRPRGADGNPVRVPCGLSTPLFQSRPARAVRLMPAPNRFAALAPQGDKLSMSADIGTLCYARDDTPRTASASRPVSPVSRRAHLATDADGLA